MKIARKKARNEKSSSRKKEKKQQQQSMFSACQSVSGERLKEKLARTLRSTHFELNEFPSIFISFIKSDRNRNAKKNL
jgi:hypothetical protein